METEQHRRSQLCPRRAGKGDRGLERAAPSHMAGCGVCPPHAAWGWPFPTLPVSPEDGPNEGPQVEKASRPCKASIPAHSLQNPSGSPHNQPYVSQQEVTAPVSMPTPLGTGLHPFSTTKPFITTRDKTQCWSMQLSPDVHSEI